MNDYPMLLFLVFPTLLLVLTALLSEFSTGIKVSEIKNLSFIASMAGILTAATLSVHLYLNGESHVSIWSYAGLGFSLHVDALNVLILMMISLLSFIILKFSYQYLEGDPRHAIFIGRLSLTIATVQIMVLSGNLLQLLLAWICTSAALHRLLLFYPERPRAVIAARKKFIMARISDLFLLAGSALLYIHIGSGELPVLFAKLQSWSANSLPFEISCAAFCFVIAALLKSAQFPTHGWLIEVMETPTPVSALLHAGLLNAGPFLMIRMSNLIQLSTPSSVTLIIIGGLTALIASIVYLTQSSVKTALAYSSIAHMGFSLMICGVGVYSAALLHMMAHSFYKAHAFLSSGSTIELIRSAKLKLPVRTGKPLKILLAISGALTIYSGIAFLKGVHPVDDFGLFFTSTIVVMGIIMVLVSSVDSDSYLQSIMRSVLSAIAVVVSFFFLEEMFHQLIQSQVPRNLKPESPVIIAALVILVIFVFALALQLIASPKSAPWKQKMAVHFRNGFYINALLDRWLGAFRIKSSQPETY